MLKYQITEQEYNEALRLSKETKLKRVEKRLQIVIRRYEGESDEAIAKSLRYHPKSISRICKQFKEQSAKEFARHKYGGNRQVVSDEKEAEILESFRKEAEDGQVIRATDIKKVFDEHRGKDTGRGYIYMLLKRHKWRLVVPRGAHPQKASEAEIEASNRGI